MRVPVIAALLACACGRSWFAELPSEDTGRGDAAAGDTAAGDAAAGDAAAGDATSGDDGPLLTIQLWTASLTVQVGVCHRLKVSFLNAAADHVAPPATTVRFAPPAGISVFSDDGCSVATTEVAVGPGEAFYYVSFMATATGALEAPVTAPPHVPATLSLTALQPTWSQAGTAPPYGARHKAAAAVWPMADQMIVYGGGPSDNSAFADMWAWDGQNWTELCDPCPPGPRVGHGMAFDGNRGRLVIFGGAEEWPPVSRLGDTWLWDGTSFEQLAGTGPSARASFGFAEGAWHQRTYLFGGDTDVGFSDELWIFDASGWTRAAPAGVWPGSRAAVGASFDFERDRFVIYGGTDGGVLDDAWAWDGNGWSELCTSCTGTPRSAVALVYYPPAFGLYAIGGYNGSTETAATWDFSVIPPVLLWADPPTRDSVSATYDPARSVLLTIGGNGDSCGGDCSDLWTYGGP